MREPVLIPSKFESTKSMIDSCTGHVNKKVEATTAPQSLTSVKRAERVDVRIGLII